MALEAAEQLAGEGIDAEVIDLRTLRPLDKATVLESLKKTNRLVVVEEGWPVCSISSEISSICMEEGFDWLDAPVIRVTNEDVPLPYAANLEKAALVTSAQVIEAAKHVCYRCVSCAGRNGGLLRIGGQGKAALIANRSEGRRVGQEGVSPCRSRWSP